MRKFLIPALLSLVVRVAAQSPYEFFYNNALAEDDVRPPDADYQLFMNPLGDDATIFERLSEFDFGFVRWSRRGYERDLTRERWGGVRMNGMVSYMLDYQLNSVLRQAKQKDGFGGDARSLVRSGGRVQGLAFNRKGRGGVRASWGGEIPHRDAYAGVAVSHRAGRDPRIGGVFMDESSLLGAVDWRDFSFAVAALRSENGLRSYATKEVFSLTGDKFYNPSWGWWGDDERSSRTINRQSINALASWAKSVGRSSFDVSAVYRAGREQRGGLAWFDAATPYPDYYRYMPDYEPVNSKDGWLVGDPRVTQIDWALLVEQNMGRPDQVAYILESKVEDMDYFGVSLHGETRLGNGWRTSYGVDIQHDTRVRYKQLESLLGAAPFVDIDWHLQGDEVFGARDLNDVRNPGRMVGEGDRFGYNYRLVASGANARAAAHYRSDKLRFEVGLEAGAHRVQREGYYEKEIFKGGLSFGRSKDYVFNPWDLRASAGWNFSPRQFLDLRARMAETAPWANNIFLNPDYSNIAMEELEAVKISDFELIYRATWERFDFDVAAFWTTTRDESAVYRYWDDIASAYADMAVNQIDKRYYGVELGAEWEISPRFTLSIGGTMGSYTYSADAQTIITDDASREVIATGGRARLKGYNLATSPARAATAAIEYDTWGWIASLSVSYVGGRYVASTPLRRMGRAYNLAGSLEMHSRFVEQERLDDAVALNVFILRSLELFNGRLTATLSIDNLLGTDIIYHGYEQMRVQRSGVAPALNWKPFPSKYLYNYGRTYYISATYAF